MTGTIINATAIIVAGLIGLTLRNGIPDNISRTMQDGLGLLIIIIGVQYGLKADNLAVIGLSLALGAAIGEWRRWEDRLDNLGQRLQKRFGNGNCSFV